MKTITCDICGYTDNHITLNRPITYQFKVKFWERSRVHTKKFDVCENCLRKIREGVRYELRSH